MAVLAGYDYIRLNLCWSCIIHR